MDSRQGVLTGLHILVVEDDVDAREILKSLLGYFGALVSTAATVREALASLGAVAPDIVIADMILGRRNDGFHLIAGARKAGIDVPFICTSGQDFDPRRLEQAGFAAYLRKPLEHNKLVDTILAVLRRR